MRSALRHTVSSAACRGGWLSVAPVRVARRFAGAVPEGLTLGRPFRTLTTGVTYDRFTGRPIDDAPSLTEAHLREMARIIRDRREQDPVVIDFNHGSAIGATPAQAQTLGLILDAWVERTATGAVLIVQPAFNDAGAAVVRGCHGALWSSPEFVVGPVFDRSRPGVQVGTAAVLAVSLTPRPAQTNDLLDPVMLSERVRDMARRATKRTAVRAAPGDVMDEAAILAALDALGLSTEALAAAADAIAAAEGEEIAPAIIAALDGVDGVDIEAVKAALMPPADDASAEPAARAEVDDAELAALREKAGMADALAEELAQVKAELDALRAQAQADGGEPAVRAEVSSLRSELARFRAEAKAAALRGEAVEAAMKVARAEAAAQVAKAEDDASFASFLGDGRVAPAERETFIAARSEHRAGRTGWFDSQFSDRAPGSVFTRGEVGHGARPEHGDMAKHQAINAYATEHGVPYDRALTAMRSINHPAVSATNRKG